MSGEWHTGEVVNLCKSYGFIRISKDGKSEDIFFYYGDVKGREPHTPHLGLQPIWDPQPGSLART